MYENHLSLSLSSGTFLKTAKQKGKPLEEVLYCMHGGSFPELGSAYGRTDLCQKPSLSLSTIPSITGRRFCQTPFPHLTEAEKFESRTVTRMLFSREEVTVQLGNTVNMPLEAQKMLYFPEQTREAFCSLGRLYPWTAQPDAEVLTVAESCKGRSNTSEVNRFKLTETRKEWDPA